MWIPDHYRQNHGHYPQGFLNSFSSSGFLDFGTWLWGFVLIQLQEH